MKKTSIIDIASTLSLSRNTVSKALSGSEIVAPETRRLVVKTAIEMGYPKNKITFPDELGNEGIKKKADNILLLCNKFPSGFWSRIIMGISDIVGMHHDNMLLHVVTKDEEEYCISPRELTESVSGVIFLSVFDRSYTEAIIRTGVPCVFLDAPVDYAMYLNYGDIILPEGYSPAKSITQSLINQGLKRLCFIGDITYCKSIMDRYVGFLNAQTDAGIKPDKNIHFINHTNEKYYILDEVMEVINRLDYIPDAIVCANDDIAKDVYQILKKSRLQIPQDIAVTGFDNSEAAELLDPALTTVSVHNNSIGKRLAEQLYIRIKEPNRPHEIIFVASDVMSRASSVKYAERR